MLIIKKIKFRLYNEYRVKTMSFQSKNNEFFRVKQNLEGLDNSETLNSKKGDSQRNYSSLK